MFSFHKPRVYRSTEGCCICRAKSSSSRFTDSKKYELDSVKCFNLENPRQGEICNACVLLVKRFKRLPVGSNRHWGHVVDARIGPGMKSISKFKRLKEESQQQKRQNSGDKPIQHKISSVSEKFCKIFRKNKKKLIEVKEFSKKPEDNSSDENSSPDTLESQNSDEEEIYRTRRRRLSGISRRKGRKPIKLSKRKLEDAGFFDEKDWIPRWLCCGVVYENSRIGAIIVDHEKFKPCTEHEEIFKLAFMYPLLQLVNLNMFDKTDETTAPLVYPSNLSPTHNITSMHLFTESVPTDDQDSKLSSCKLNTNKNPFALKKHQLYYKRQSDGFQHNECPPSFEANINEGMINPSTLFKPGQNISAKSTSKFKHSFLQKIKSDTNKMMKNSLEKVLLTSRVRQLELNEDKDIKTIVSSTSSMTTSNVVPTTAVDTSTATKFSDNSSDSGFDENLPDHSSAPDGKDRKILIRPIESLFVSSKIPITLPAPPGSQNATIRSHKTIHTPHSIAILNNRKIRAIYNATSDGGLTCVAVPPTSSTTPTAAVVTNAQSLSAPGSSIVTHKKVLYVKGKQNIDATNN